MSDAPHPIVEQPELPTSDPPVDEESRRFWDDLAGGRFTLPRCRSCGLHVWYPRSHCPDCFGDDLEWVEAAGTGTVHTFTVVRKGPGPWREVGPYVLAQVELAEGPRVFTNVVDVDPASVSIGLPVRLVLHRSPGGHLVPRFRPA